MFTSGDIEKNGDTKVDDEDATSRDAENVENNQIVILPKTTSPNLQKPEECRRVDRFGVEIVTRKGAKNKDIKSNHKLTFIDQVSN